MTWTGVLVVLVVTDVTWTPFLLRWLRCVKVFPWILIGNLLNRSLLFLQQALDCLGGESRRDELRRDASESTTDIQKDDDAAHAIAELALVNRGYAAAK